MTVTDSLPDRPLLQEQDGLVNLAVPTAGPLAELARFRSRESGGRRSSGSSVAAVRPGWAFPRSGGDCTAKTRAARCPRAGPPCAKVALAADTGGGLEMPESAAGRRSPAAQASVRRARGPRLGAELGEATHGSPAQGGARARDLLGVRPIGVGRPSIERVDQLVQVVDVVHGVHRRRVPRGIRTTADF